ncbi:MAG: zf-HC2 domain-containing protein, partial [Deltaproteobacteria bacterium]|nr:zf-HC2 domain-containing protein [Deltaproteobacteria bacterium]
MKKCKQFEKQLIAYLHGELEEKQGQALREHLETCALCQAELETQRATLKLLGEALEAAPAPQELRPWRMLQRYDRPPRISLGNIWFPPQFKSALAASAITVCFIFFSGLFVVFRVFPKHEYAVSAPAFAPPPTVRPSLRLKKPRATFSETFESRPASRIADQD